MSAKQLMVLASELGAEHFYGIQDPFREMRMEEIRAEYPALLSSLEQLGYLSQGFDEAVSIPETIRQLIKVCIACEQYLTVDEIHMGKSAPGLVVYKRASVCACIEKKEDFVKLRPVKLDDGAGLVLRQLKELYAPQSDVPLSPLVYPLEQKTLQLCAVQGVEVRQVLREAGLPDPIAALLAATLQQQGHYCCIHVVDLQHRSLQSLCVAYNERLLLQLRPDTEAPSTWLLQLRSLSDIEEELLAMLQWRKQDGKM